MDIARRLLPRAVETICCGNGDCGRRRRVDPRACPCGRGGDSGVHRRHVPVRWRRNLRRGAKDALVAQGGSGCPEPRVAGAELRCRASAWQDGADRDRLRKQDRAKAEGDLCDGGAVTGVARCRGPLPKEHRRRHQHAPALGSLRLEHGDRRTGVGTRLLSPGRVRRRRRRGECMAAGAWSAMR